MPLKQRKREFNGYTIDRRKHIKLKNTMVSIYSYVTRIVTHYVTQDDYLS